MLNTGAYSNTGGQASTASLTGQDSDLSRFGAAHAGKQEERKELALIAAFHPNVFVVQSCAGMQAHFLKHVVEFLNHNDSPAVLDVYTPCQGEQGIADPQASRHARLAVESRMSPLFVHDPRRGADLHSRFSLDGNPDPDKDWTTNTIEYVEDGATKLMQAPLTPADFALSEGRFRKQFRPLAADAVGVPIHDYVELSPADRVGKTPFVWTTDAEKKLTRLEASQTIVHLVQERRKNWRTLQYLAGLDVAKLDSDHHAEVEALKRQYTEAMEARESSIELDRQGNVGIGRIVQRAGFRRSGGDSGGWTDDTPHIGRASRGGPCRQGQRRGAGRARRRGRREVQQLQDLLSGDPGTVREDPDRRRRRGEGGGPSHSRRARQDQGHAGADGEALPRRREL